MPSHSCPYTLDPQTYLARPAERLALQGYRGWTWTLAKRSPCPWQEVCRLYRADLSRHADVALQALSDFLEALGLSANCSLRMLQAGSGSLCRDEALVLTLVSAIQHGDQEAVELAVASVCCPAMADRVAHAAGIYALTLRMLGRVLLPIPVQAIGHICAVSAGASPGESPSLTLH